MERETRIMRNSTGTTIETTLGELIAAVCEAVLENAESAEKSYALAAIVVADLLTKDEQGRCTAELRPWLKSWDKSQSERDARRRKEL